MSRNVKLMDKVLNIRMNDFCIFAKRRSIYIVLFSLLCCIVCGVYSLNSQKSVFVAKSSISVSSELQEKPTQDLMDYINKDVVQLCLDKIQSKEDIRKVTENFSVDRVPNSSIVVFTYKATDPNVAKNYLSVFTDYIVSVINNKKGYVVNNNMPTHLFGEETIGPSLLKYTSLGLFGGIIIGMMTLICNYLLILYKRENNER